MKTLQIVTKPLAPEVGIHTFTPEYAKMLLERNEGNRKINQPLVDELAHAMSRGSFKLNGETIKIATSGRILDGQHRLLACAQSEQPFVSLLVTRVPEDCFDTIDVGRKRSVGDILGHAGFRNAAVLGATIRWAEAIRLNQLALGRGGHRMAPQEILAFAIANPASADIASLVTNKGGRVSRVVSPTHLAPVLYLAHLSDQEKAASFFDKFVTGESLGGKHPILHLRNHLIGIRALRVATRAEEIVAAIINGWNAYRNDLDVDRIEGAKRLRNGTRQFPAVA